MRDRCRATGRRWYGRSWLGLALLAVSLLWSGVAEAGGFTIPLIGGRMAGRMAFVGYPDDTSAMFHNPAGLVLIKGYRADLSVLGIYSGTNYERYTGTYLARDAATGISRTVGDQPLAPGVSPDPPLGVLPNGGFAGNFGLKDWAFGFGVYSPHNATGNFPADGAQRYQAIKGTIATIYMMPTVAWRPLPWLAVGAQIGPTFAKIGYIRAQKIPGAQEDAELELDASAWSFAWGVGILIQPIAPLSIGVSYSSQTSFTFKGDITLRNLPVGSVANDANATSTSGSGKSEFDFPRILRVGVNWRFSESFDLGFDFQWQNYKVYDAIRLSLDSPLQLSLLGQSVEIGDVSEPKDSSDSISFALGGRYSPMERLDLRAGVLYDSSPYPDNTYTILNPDHDKAGFSLGATYTFPFGLELTLAYVHLFYFDRTITETKVCQTLPIGGLTNCLPDTQAGGEIHGKQVIVFGLQTSYLF